MCESREAYYQIPSEKPDWEPMELFFLIFHYATENPQ